MPTDDSDSNHVNNYWYYINDIYDLDTINELWRTNQLHLRTETVNQSQLTLLKFYSQ